MKNAARELLIEESHCAQVSKWMQGKRHCRFADWPVANSLASGDLQSTGTQAGQEARSKKPEAGSQSLEAGCWSSILYLK